MKMRFFVDVHDIKPGMIIGEDIFYGENLLLSKGTIIKSSYIEHLIFRGISKVSVLAEKSYYKDLFSNPVEAFYVETYEIVGNIIKKFKDDRPISVSDIFPVVENIIEAVFINPDSILLLPGFRGMRDYYYAHSLDVCIYSLITAKAMNLDYEEVVTLGLGAILHDVGKTKVSDAILLKQGKLTRDEFEEVKKHSKYGYDIIRKIPEIKRSAATIALQHHERCDGSGYPNNLKSEDIHLLSKIVSIADIYDALTSDRVYNNKILPHEAAEYLLGISSTLIDCEITKIFLKNVAIYPKGCQVLLNTNEIAVVLDSNINMPLRPHLKVITDKNRNPISVPVELKLQTNHNIFISHKFN